MSEIEQQSLASFTEKSYLDYSMYVILDRALPHIGDGLKPVQRRIVYAMSELGLKATAKYKKSARTVGDVLGKFHPHGDTACYEAMVHMAQPFTYRYPLIDGQGNWGSADDPKSFAAMRYTESKLAAYTETLLSEVGLGTVDWQPNFDGSLNEPQLLPARLPNLLLNGATGIAVGMATDIPPHNLHEIADACVALLDNSNTSFAEICQIIQGPDFPTNAEIITSPKDIMATYEKGHGSVRMRAVYAKEQDNIVITALPHQVSGAKILEQIAQQMQVKKLPMVADLRDESDHETPTRLVIIPRSNRIDVESLMSHLFATTDLERSYRINLNVIGINGRPQVKSILQILQEWLKFRLTTVRRRLEYRLEKILDRLHILDALLIAFLNIDEVIAIIRYEEKPKSVLMQKYNLTDRQAEAILDMKLRHLAKLEEIKIRSEQDELSDERQQLEKILASEKRLKSLVRKEIIADAQQFGDKRQSPFVMRSEAKAISEEAMLPNEPMTIIISQRGWVRAAKGHEVNSVELNYKAGDSFLCEAHGRSNQQAVFFDSTGRAYALPTHQLASARGQGEPLTGKLSPPPGANFIAVMAGDPELHCLLASDAGYGFIAKLSDFFVRNRAGKAALNLPTHSQMLMPQIVSNLNTDNVAIVSNDGRLLVFPLKQLPELSRGKGNKIMNIPSAKLASREEYVLAIAVLAAKQSLIIYAGKRHINLSVKELASYMGERGRRGMKLPRGFQKVDRIEAV